MKQLGVWIVLVTMLHAPSYAATVADGEAILARADVTVTSSATVVASANGGRVSLSCTNTSSGVHVRWGDATVTATKGQQLNAGSSIEIRNRDAVYMISEGANVTVACTEETR